MTPYAVANTFWNSFIASSSLITASELGDKTFFITSIMSVQRSRVAVFLGAMSAMTVMNILSICLGLLTTSIPPWIIHYISISLFLIFGLKMIRDGLRMTEEESMEEYEEAQKVVSENKDVGDAKPTLLTGLFGKQALVFVQVFSLIFFAEWGDKSQLSTILLAAREGIWAVGLGAFVGYFICNAVAVLGSRAIVQIISVKKITTFGGFVFVACALLKFVA